MRARKNSKPPLRLEWVEAGTLAGNPRNWRRHPDAQTRALRDVLGDPDIGWAGAVLYNERTNRLVDGHARVKLSDPKALVPVLIGNWSESAEAKILLTLDPIAGMAQVDDDALRALVEDVAGELPESLSDLVDGLLESAAADEGGGSGPAKMAPPKDFKEFGEDIETEHQCPKCGYRWSGGGAAPAEADGAE